MADLPELIVHIGAGKAGSTSLQFTLMRNPEALAAAGLSYMGLALEEVPGATAHAWCERDRPQLFFAPRPDTPVEAEVEQVLRDELERLAGLGVRQVVWSNEAFLVQKWRILRILQKVAADGVKVRPVVYMRRHDKRAISAYTEFEIRSKRHQGALHKYADWLEEAAPRLTYADHVETWAQHFPQIELYNFDEIGDVAQHFCGQILGLEGVSSVRANEARGAGLMTAWTVFSGSRPGPTWAADFRRLAAPLQITRNPNGVVPKPQELLPDAGDVEATQETFRADLEQINARLQEQGQPPMVFDPVTPPELEASDWELQQMLFRMTFALQAQVLALKEEVAELRETLEKKG
ncbi:hypothetical protein [Marinibacterium profundimaris]|uniref:Sulfotransferase domain-containing protein n=1 Tax=Marinibacterium profundimaris TaxID=1679460 RepID=A0A225NFK2_9RHOB|nr:hypothetical protein [Marinibacterium profundimaris]MAU94908.1 hypothetical protein [Fulvimarina sp.]OWU68390.1 hypothetical protein ATO3_24205 [Marinibacterium profundimaris]